jgi:hypothetical protein
MRTGVRGRARDGRGVQVNGLVNRPDLREVHVRAAIEAGVPVVCSTDAHSVRGLGNMRPVGRNGPPRLGGGDHREYAPNARNRVVHQTPAVNKRQSDHPGPHYTVHGTIRTGRKASSRPRASAGEQPAASAPTRQNL